MDVCSNLAITELPKPPLRSILTTALGIHLDTIVYITFASSGVEIKLLFNSAVTRVLYESITVIALESL